MIVRVIFKNIMKDSEIFAEYDDGYVYSVDILYGPTKVCGVIKHRTGRVEHIKGKSSKNHQVKHYD